MPCDLVGRHSLTDEVRSRRERDKLTIAEVCADLGISRRTFYEWRAKGRTPRVHHVAERQPPRPPVRIPAVAARPLARQAMTTDTRGQTCMFFYGKAGRFFPEQKAIILPEEFWA
jgi:predicted DNA-binding transcriptional regulator AlpA